MCYMESAFADVCCSEIRNDSMSHSFTGLCSRGSNAGHSLCEWIQIHINAIYTVAATAVGRFGKV